MEALDFGWYALEVEGDGISLPPNLGPDAIHEERA